MADSEQSHHELLMDVLRRAAEGGVVDESTRNTLAQSMVFETWRRHFKMPERIKASLDDYWQKGLPPGSFVRAVLENDLHQAIANADAECALALTAIVRYVYNDMPGDCWGSRRAVQKYLTRKRELDARR
jgi:hypothetical protein